MNKMTLQEMRDFVSTARTILALRKKIEQELNNLTKSVLDNYEKSVCNLIQKGKSAELEEIVSEMESIINKEEYNEIDKIIDTYLKEKENEK